MLDDLEFRSLNEIPAWETLDEFHETWHVHDQGQPLENGFDFPRFDDREVEILDH